MTIRSIAARRALLGLAGMTLVACMDLTATNNGAERALRPCAVYRKITNGFRSAWGAVLYADIRSVVETARRRSIRAIDAIRLTLDGSLLLRRIGLSPTTPGRSPGALPTPGDQNL